MAQVAMAWSGDTRYSKINYHQGQKKKRKKKLFKKLYLEILNNKCTHASDFVTCYLCVKRAFPVIFQVKAEFLESLNSAEKQVRDYQSRLEALNENFCRAGALRDRWSNFLFNLSNFASLHSNKFYLCCQKEFTSLIACTICHQYWHPQMIVCIVTLTNQISCSLNVY